MRYIIYSRVSTKKQETESQRQRCLERAKSMMQDDDQLFYFDEAHRTSRLKWGERPKLKEMLDFVKKGDTIIVFSLDRIARKGTELSYIYEDLLIGEGINVISLKQGSMKPSMIHIHAFVAQEERESISYNTKEALLSKQDRMEKVGTLWYGFKTDPTVLNPRENDRTFGKPYKLIPDPVEYPICLMMIQMRQMSHTYEEIADYLNDNGYLNRSGKLWQRMSVYRIIKRSNRYDPDLFPQALHPFLQSRSLCAV